VTVDLRRHAPLLIVLVLITGTAWWHLLRLAGASADHAAMTAAMGMPVGAPWGPADLWLTFVMWVVMMTAMMLPSAVPVLWLVASARSRLGRTGAQPVTLLFGLGYLLVWTGFSGAATLAEWLLHDAALLSPAMAASSPQLGGAIAIAAGLYQWTPVKQRCLTRCQSPLQFLITRWRGGPLGSLRMGLGHGVYCLGCCWALMTLLFTVGVMNLAWVAALGALVLVEKAAPGGLLLARAAGALMIAAGAGMMIA
jgi:predicted metal-binding membrane protein